MVRLVLYTATAQRERERVPARVKTKAIVHDERDKYQDITTSHTADTLEICLYVLPMWIGKARVSVNASRSRTGRNALAVRAMRRTSDKMTSATSTG